LESQGASVAEAERVVLVNSGSVAALKERNNLARQDISHFQCSRQAKECRPESQVSPTWSKAKVSPEMIAPQNLNTDPAANRREPPAPGEEQLKEKAVQP